MFRVLLAPVALLLFSRSRQHSAIFFFQAEDGIRDATVTGVQTCALPICRPASAPPRSASGPGAGARAAPRGAARACGCRLRSEERRVGKECRARWARDPCKEKKRQVTSKGQGECRAEADRRTAQTDHRPE